MPLVIKSGTGGAVPPVNQAGFKNTATTGSNFNVSDFTKDADVLSAYGQNNPFNVADFTQDPNVVMAHNGFSMDTLGAYANKAFDFASDTIDEVSSRLNAAGLMEGGAAGLVDGIAGKLGVGGLLDGLNQAAGALGGISGAVGGTGGSTASVAGAQQKDWRIRLSVGPKSGILYKSQNSGVLLPLGKTNGLVFPYTPQVTVAYQNNYSAVTTTHSLQSMQAFKNNEVSSITIQGTFTAQNADEADYVFAAVHFLRSASKMFFGNAENPGNVGAPPPILFLNGYGERYFPNVPCVLTSFQHIIPDDVDFVEATTSAQKAMVPTTSSITLTLVPQYSKARMATFNFDQFARGDLIGNKGNFL